MTGTTYADLVSGASRQLTAGINLVRFGRFDSPAHARDVLGDYLGLLEAIESHTYALITPARLVPGGTRDPAVQCAVAMVDGLRELTGPTRPHPSVLERADRPFAQAASLLRAASDMLAVHVGPWGRPLTPDTVLLTQPAARTPALVAVAAQLDAALTCETALCLKSLQAGLSSGEVRRALPGLGANRAHAHALAVQEPERHSGLARLRLVGEAPRTHDPVLHAADLMHRLRTSAWNLASRPDYSIRTLTDLATAALAVHAHAAAAHGADLTTTPATLTEETRPLAAHAAKWRDLRNDLTSYIAPGPADPVVRADTRALQTLLPRLAPLSGAAPADHRTQDMLLTGARSFDQVGQSVSTAFRALARSGHVHLNARHLTGDQLDDDSALIAAKLSAATVVAPESRWQHSLKLAAAVSTAATPHLTATETPVATAAAEAVPVLHHEPLARSLR